MKKKIDNEKFDLFPLIRSTLNVTSYSVIGCKGKQDVKNKSNRLDPGTPWVAYGEGGTVMAGVALKIAPLKW